MKKIIESELISIAHRILKLKGKSDIDALYNESKNVFEKISVLKFYEDNKFRIDTNITDEVIEKALFPIDEHKNNIVQESLYTIENVSVEDTKNEDSRTTMDLDLINELIEDSEKTDIVSFDDEILDEVSIQIQETIEEFIDELPIDFVAEITPYVDVDKVFEIKTNDFDRVINELEQGMGDTLKVVSGEIEQAIPVVEIDPVFNLQLEDIKFEERIDDAITNEILEEIENSIVQNEKQPSFENQHLINSSEGNEVPFHQVPLNRTINDAFSHVITIGLNDRIAFEKNLFDGNSEDLNRVLSQLNTIENFQEAQDFIEDLVKPDFNYWKGKEEYEERFMQLIQKRFL